MIDDMDGGDPAEDEARLKSDFADWFKRLQALTDEVLVAEDWTSRWFEGCTPEEALKEL
jgi:hypothetical protein